MRYAWVSRRNVGAESALERYLPNNYGVVGQTAAVFLIEGEDDHGWTLDDYVIPRLASGLITCVEIPAEVGRQITEGTP